MNIHLAIPKVNAHLPRPSEPQTKLKTDSQGKLSGFKSGRVMGQIQPLKKIIVKNVKQEKIRAT